MERFWSKTKRNEKTGCLEWTAARYYNGYGVFRFPKGNVMAHRFSYELANGVHPGKMLVCHICDNPGCVEPSHLFLGTPSDNNNDKVRKGRDVRKRTKRKLTPTLLKEADVIAIRQEYAAGKISMYKLAARYNVDRSTIGKAINRQNWNRVS